MNSNDGQLTPSSQQKLTQYSSDLVKKGLDLAFKLSQESQSVSHLSSQAITKKESDKIWKCFCILNPHLNNIKSIKLNADGSILAFVDGWGTAIIWNFINNQLIATLDCGYQKKPDYAILNEFYKIYQKFGGDYELYFTQAHQSLTGFSSNQIREWNLVTNQLIQNINLESQFVKYKNLSNNIIITTLRQSILDGVESIGIWNLKTCQLIKKLNTDFHTIEYVQLSLDNRFLVISGNVNLYYNQPLEEEEYWIYQCCIKTWDLFTDELLYTINEFMYKVPSDNESRCFDSPLIKISFDNKYLVSVDNFVSDEDTYIVKVWDLSQGKLLYTLPKPAETDFFEIARNNQLIIYNPDDETVKIWDLSAGTLLFNIQGDYCSLSLEHDILVIRDTNGKLKFWNLKTGQLIQTLPKHSFPIYDIEFSQDGKVFLTRDKESIRLWKLYSEDENIQTKISELDQEKLIKNLILQGNHRYIIEENYEGAIESYTKALSFNVNNAEAYNKRSTAYSAIGDFQKAMEDLQKAQQLS